MILTLPMVFYSIFLGLSIKKLQDFICHKEFFRNFVLSEYCDFCLYNCIIHTIQKHNNFR